MVFVIVGCPGRVSAVGYHLITVYLVSYLFQGYYCCFLLSPMDPWSSPVALIQSNGVENFEDNFVVPGCSLPDSAQYLAVLERRLAKIKKGGGTTEKEIINSIGEKKRDCIVRLLVEDFERLEAESIDEDIPTKWLKSHINPQQPLTISEVVELVKADYLAKASEESDSKEVQP